MQCGEHWGYKVNDGNGDDNRDLLINCSCNDNCEDSK